MVCSVTIEHLFRFLKQHMGLNSNRSLNLVSAGQWMLLCALAYWQLLLMRDQVKPNRPAWYPSQADRCTMLAPYQVQRPALCSFRVGFCIFVGVGHTGPHSQTCWKRHVQTQKLLPGSAYSLSGDLQEQKDIQITGCQSIIGICFSIFKVLFDCTFFLFYSATLKSS